MTEMNSRTTGYALLGIGALMIVLRMVGFSMASLLWPLWVLVPGALMLYMGFRNEKALPGWAIPGALVAGTGAILFFLNLTGRWEAWSYMWALYPAFVGAATHQVGQQNGNEDMANGGQNAFRSGLWMFVAFGLFFEVLIFGGLLGNGLIPLLFLAAGAYMIFGRKDAAGHAKFVMPWAWKREKAKRGLPAEKDKRTGVNPDLRRRMDEAIYEDDKATV